MDWCVLVVFHVFFTSIVTLILLYYYSVSQELCNVYPHPCPVRS